MFVVPVRLQFHHHHHHHHHHHRIFVFLDIMQTTVFYPEFSVITNLFEKIIQFHEYL